MIRPREWTGQRGGQRKGMWGGEVIKTPPKVKGRKGGILKGVDSYL